METFESKFAEINEGKIHYVEFGSAFRSKGADTVVLVHGWPDFWYGWRKNIKPIADSGFHVVAIDLPGFGQSFKPTQTKAYSYANICSYLASFLNVLFIKQAIFIGHDWGGAVVWRMALYQKARVKAVGAVCTPYRPRTSKYMPLTQIAQMIPQFYYQVYFSKNNGRDAAAVIDQDVPRLFKACMRKGDKSDYVGRWIMKESEPFWGTLPQDIPRSDLLTEEELKCYIKTYEQTKLWSTLQYYNTDRINWDDGAGKDTIVTQPSLMVTTGKDRVLSKAMTVNMENWVPMLSRGHVEDAGHWVLVEQDTAVNKILIEWLCSLSANSTCNGNVNSDDNIYHNNESNRYSKLSSKL